MSPSKQTHSLLALLAVLLLTSPIIASAKDLYRYINDQGNMVVDDHVPPKYAAKGHEVINPEGVVLKVVPRKLTEEELTQRGVVERQAQDAAAEEERLLLWDESLMLRYSTIEDIEAARERTLRDLRIRVSILKSNTRGLKQQVENYQRVAAGIERSGGTVGVERLTLIEELQFEISATERSIADRQAEVALVQKGFQEDIGRFEMLLEVVELRRSLSSGDRAR
ncbi:MAG: hypothetical protein ACJAZ0_001717 [Halioglobus sp.]|jgi:hypothetical protein